MSTTHTTKHGDKRVDYTRTPDAKRAACERRQARNLKHVGIVISGGAK
jgi:hypothetical protein